MATNATSVAETAGLVEVCAEITGVTGLLECAVTNAPTLTGSIQAGSEQKLATLHNILHFRSQMHKQLYG